MARRHFPIGRFCASGIVIFAAGTALAQTTTINNNVALQWTDRVGGLHPARGIVVEWWDDDSIIGEGLSEQFLGFSSTDGGGNTVFATNEDDFFSHIEFFSQIRAQVFNVADTHTIASVRNLFTDPEPYKRRDPHPSGTWDVLEGSATAIPGFATLDNSGFVGTSMTALQTIRFMNNFYANAPYSATLPSIQISYNSGNAGSSMGHNQFTLGYTSWANIDVILHEYGHHVAENNNLDYRDVNGDGYGFQHFFANDNIQSTNGGTGHGDTVGSRLAWQEGIATYLGMVAMHRGNLLAAIPGMPADDYDVWYDNYNPAPNATNVPSSTAGFSISIETRDTATRTAGGATAGVHDVRIQGEGNESSIMRVLWDLQDDAQDGYSKAGRSDRAKLGPTKVYNLAKTSDTFYDFWKRLTPDVLGDKTQISLTGADPDRKALSTLGEILEEYGISAEPVSEGTLYHTDSLLFREQANSNSYRYNVYIMKMNWDFHANFNFADNQLATLNNWALGLNDLTYFPANTFVPGQMYRWAVLSTAAIEGNVSPGQLRDWYWSGANVFTYVPEPGSALLILGAALLVMRRRTPNAKI